MSRLLRDTDPVVAAILDGEHDDVLEHISRATDHRLKHRARSTGLRHGSRIRVTDSASLDIAGRLGTVERVNPKTIRVNLDPTHEFDTATRWRLPHSWVEAA